MPKHWSEAEIAQILKSRLCSEGIEYYIKWRTGERSTWELRESFRTVHLFDAFDEAFRTAVANQLPLRKFEKKLVKERISRLKDGYIGKGSKHADNEISLSTPMYDLGYQPSEVVACVEVAGIRFALVAYRNDTRRDFVRFSEFQKRYPSLARTFIKERHLQHVFR
uniref:Chromo domain-containing protein n=1 Tax=Panagrellus redivivus TaxID=6233 RepID=A0A7E4W6I7_PANRE